MRITAERYLSLQEVGDALGVSDQTVRRWVKAGELAAYKPGKEYRIKGSDLEEFLQTREVGPKAQPPPLEDERLSDWEAFVEEAQRLRETGWAQMWKVLSEWRASKKRGESYAARHEYLDEIGSLLQEVYDAEMTLGEAYITAALTQGGSKAPWPRYLQSESRKMGHFYGALFNLVTSAGLSIRTGTSKADSKDVPLEERPREVEETPAA